MPPDDDAADLRPPPPAAGPDAAHHAVLLADDARRLIDVNATASRLLGISRARLLTLRVDDITAPDARPGVAAAWQQFLRDGTQEGEWALITPRGPLTVSFVAVANVVAGRHLSLLSHGDLRHKRPPALSAREREVLGLVAVGLRSREIAERLHLSVPTVETHLRRTMDRLGARSRAHAVALALDRGEIRLGAG